MPLPATEPTSVALVKTWLDITDGNDDERITLTVGAVNALVRSLPVAGKSNTDPAPAAWPDNVRLGATMLAARVFRRKDTPGGLAVTGDFGVAYVRRSDPDVAQLLELGEYAAPGVG